MSAADFEVKVTVTQIEGSKTSRLTCGSCDWMETAGSASVATRKKNQHIKEHSAATHGRPGVPTIYDAIEGTDEMPEGSFRDPVPVSEVVESLDLRGGPLLVGDVLPGVTEADAEQLVPPEEYLADKIFPAEKAELCAWCDRLHPGGPEYCSEEAPAPEVVDAPLTETFHTWACREAQVPCDGTKGCYEILSGTPVATDWSTVDDDPDRTKDLAGEWVGDHPTGWSAPKSAEDVARRLEITPPHTRTETDLGPDYCKECSHEAQDWVVWPCPEMAPKMPENDLPEVPLAVSLTRARLVAQRGPSDFDKDLPDSVWHKARAYSVSATLAAKLGSAADVDFLIAREIRERIAGSRFWGNSYTRWGREREVFLEEAGLERHGIVGEDCLFFSQANPRHVASPDGIAVHPESGEVCLGEYKTSGKELTWAKMVANGYYDQVQWQLYVLEATHCWLMWEWRHGEGKDYSTYVPQVGGEHLIMRNESRIAELVARADRFLAALDAELARLESAGDQGFDPELVWLVNELIKSREDAKVAEEALRTHCEERGVKSLEIPGVAKVSYSFGAARKSFNTTAFREHQPELYEAYLEEGPPPERATLRVTPAKGEDGA